MGARGQPVALLVPRADEAERDLPHPLPRRPLRRRSWPWPLASPFSRLQPVRPRPGLQRLHQLLQELPEEPVWLWCLRRLGVPQEECLRPCPGLQRLLYLLQELPSEPVWLRCLRVVVLLKEEEEEEEEEEEWTEQKSKIENSSGFSLIPFCSFSFFSFCCCSFLFLFLFCFIVYVDCSTLFLSFFFSFRHVCCAVMQVYACMYVWIWLFPFGRFVVGCCVKVVFRHAPPQRKIKYRKENQI